MAPSIERSVQKTGATVISIADPCLPVVHFGVAIRRGAAYDAMQQSGCTRAMLEMLLRGTLQRPWAEFASHIERLGCHIGAGTGREIALLRATCLARNLDAIWSLVCEAVTEPAFDAQQCQRLFAETAADQQAARDDDDTVADIFLRRVLYKGHTFARSPVGEIEDLALLTPEDLRRVYQACFVPQNLIIIFAGDIEHNAACQMVARLCSPMGRRGGVGKNPSVAPVVPNPGCITIVDKPDRSQAQIRVGNLVTPSDGDSALALWLGLVAFGGTFTSPLTRAIREERGWSYIAQAGFDWRTQFASPTVQYTAPKNEDVAACLALQLQLHTELASKKLPEQAVSLARDYLLNRFALQIATAADLLLPILQYELLTLAPEQFLDLPKRIAGISYQDVLNAISTINPKEVQAIVVGTANTFVDDVVGQCTGLPVQVVGFRDDLNTVFNAKPLDKNTESSV